MKKQAVDKCISNLGKEIEKAVAVVMELKKKEKKWQQKEVEIEKRLKDLLGKIEELSDEKG